MKAIRIEKGVPFPRQGERGRPCIYPFAKMDVGDSFAMPSIHLRKLTAAASAHGRAYGKRFIVRSDGGEACRCWRQK